MIPLLSHEPPPRRIYGNCCGRIRFGRFCCDCGKPLVQRARRNARRALVMELAGEEIRFDSIKEASNWTGLTRRQIEHSLNGPRREDGTMWMRVARESRKKTNREAA